MILHTLISVLTIIVNSEKLVLTKVNEQENAVFLILHIFLLEFSLVKEFSSYTYVVVKN